MKPIIVDLYADGGVIQKNPSRIGGTYAFVLVRGSKILHQESGHLTPGVMKTEVVTNNQMELYAILAGLSYAEDTEWKFGKISSDSQITLGRVFHDWRLKGIPPWMVGMWHTLKYLTLQAEEEWVRGHNGHEWNEMCDRLCQAESQAYFMSLNLSPNT